MAGTIPGSPVRSKTPDGEAVVRALREAEANPVVRPLGRLATRRARPTERHETTDGTVVVPEDDEGKTPEETGPAATTHTEIQYLLLKLGADMGFYVHVASNDQGREWKGQRLGDMPRRRAILPKQFDPVTNRTIELIDVLWLDGNSIEAAFEIESTTSIYSGILRMSGSRRGTCRRCPRRSRACRLLRGARRTMCHYRLHRGPCRRLHIPPLSWVNVAAAVALTGLGPKRGST